MEIPYSLEDLKSYTQYLIDQGVLWDDAQRALEAKTIKEYLDIFNETMPHDVQKLLFVDPKKAPILINDNKTMKASAKWILEQQYNKY